MATTVDLNADVGEIPGDGDAALMPWLTSANIACGLHAGDPVGMQRTVALAIAHGVAIGAHPGWQDREGFGRRPMPEALPADIEALVLYQLGALAAITQAAGQRVRHVTVHGALATQAARDPQLALAVARAIALFDKRLRWLVMPGTELERAGQALGLPLVREAYVDRGYGADGHLLARGQPGALLEDPETAADRALAMLRGQYLVTPDGARLPAIIESLCVHGDGPHAVAMARAVRTRLAAAGIQVTAPQTA